MEEYRSHYGFLTKNVFWLTLVRVITVSASFITLPIVTAYLNPEAFGIIVLFAVEASFLSSFYGLGLSSFAGRMIYKYDRKNRNRCRQYLGVSLSAIIAASVLGMAASVPIAGMLKRMLLRDVSLPHTVFLYVPLLYAFFITIYGFATNCFVNLQQNKKFSVCIIIEFIISVPAKIIGLVWLGFGWPEIVVIELVSKAAAVLVAVWLLSPDIGFSWRRLRILPYALRYSLPYVPLNFSSWIQLQIDKVFLGRIYAPSRVGIYAAGERLGDGFSFFSRPIATTVKPEIAKRLDSRDENIREDITSFFNLFFQASLFLIFTVSIFSKEIIMILTHAEYFEAFQVIPFIMFGYMFAELTGIFQLKFVYRNKTILFPVVTFIGALVNILLNYFLIPVFGIMGAALATFFTNLGMLMICYLLSQRLHTTRYDMIRNFSMFIIVFILIGAIQSLSRISAAGLLIKLFISISYAVLLYRHLIISNKRFGGLVDTFIDSVKERIKLGALNG